MERGAWDDVAEALLPPSGPRTGCDALPSRRECRSSEGPLWVESASTRAECGPF